MVDRRAYSERLRRAGGSARLGLVRAKTLVAEALAGISSHRGTQLAASMSYYALFSLFPAAIVAAAIAGLVLGEETARMEAIDYLLDELPVSQGQGRDDLESAIDGVTRNAGAIGLFGLAALLVSASALMGATRNSIDTIFGGEVRRGALRAKVLDVLVILALGLLFSLSLAATVITELDLPLGGGIGELIETVLGAAGTALSLALTAVVFAALLHFLPVERPALRDLWPGVAFATLGYEILKRGFSFYLENFADYSAVYGSLATVIAFMFFVWLASLVFLIGAEMVPIWPRVRSGELDPDPDAGDDRPLAERLRETARGLVRRRKRVREPGEPQG